MSITQDIIIISVVMLGTMLTRFLPFILFPATKTPPSYIKYMSTVLPYAAMGLLLVYCIKDAIFVPPYGCYEILSILLVALLHKWKKNIFLSISVGTIFYMVLVQNTPLESLGFLL